MRRFLVLTISIVSCAVQAQEPFFVKNALNGLAWRSLSPSDKTLYLTGAKEAFYMAYELQMAQANLDCVRGVVGAASSWFKGSLPDVRREMDAFYENAENIPIPLMNAIVITQMKLGGTPKPELDQYRAAALQAVVN